MPSTLLLSLLWLPFAGAALVAPSSGRVGLSRGVQRLQTWLYPSLLCGQTLLTIIAIGARAPQWRFSLGSPLLRTGIAVAFELDGLAAPFLLLLSVPLFLMSLAGAHLTTRRLRRSLTLLLLAVGVAAITAQNLLTACLAWGVADLVLIGLNLLGTPVEGFPHVVRQLGANLLSTALLAAAVVLSAESGGSLEAPGQVMPLALSLAFLATALRIGVYPAPGSARHRWQATLFALASGGVLWLRLLIVTPPAMWPAGVASSLGGWMLLATAAIAARAPSLRLAFPYLALHEGTVALMASLCDSTAGPAIGLITWVSLGICLTLVHLLPTLWPAGQLPRWGRWVWAAALAPLAGAPLTLGFLSHYALLKICWAQGNLRAFWLAAFSFALAAIPLWRHLLSLSPSRIARPRFAIAWASAGGAVALEIVTVAAAIHPPLLLGLKSVPINMPTLFSFLSGSLPDTWAVILLASLAPLALGFYGARIEQRLKPITVGALDTVAAALEMHWLYEIIELLLQAARQAVDAISLTIDRVLYLGWVITWAMVFILQIV
ncbi:MAG: hypothetical protein H5T69_02290 [Chloroflexi bacterium]|nr:hypothetical protein [Chloroflexota bacterium]